MCTDSFLCPVSSSSPIWMSVDHSHSTDPGLMENMPPAYGDHLTATRPKEPRAVSPLGTHFDYQTQRKKYFVSSTVDGDPVSDSLPPSPFSRSENDPLSRRTSAISESRMSAPSTFAGTPDFH